MLVSVCGNLKLKFCAGVWHFDQRLLHGVHGAWTWIEQPPFLVSVYSWSFMRSACAWSVSVGA